MSEPIKTKRLSRKAKAAEAVAEEAPVIEEAKPPAPLMLTQDELARLKLYEAEVRVARAETETSRIRKKYFLALLDSKGIVEAEEKRHEKAVERAKEWAQKHEMVMAHISMRLNVNLKDCAFDPETGVVVVPEKSAKGSKDS